MKKLILPISVAVFAACGSPEQKADAYGNFESDEVIVSAENAGKIISMNANEGDKVASGAVLSVSDTIAIGLQRLQLQSQKASIATQQSSIVAQMAISEQQIENLNKDLQRIKKLLNDSAATQKQYDDIVGQIALANRQKQAYAAQTTAIQRQADAVQAQIVVLNDKIRTAMVKAPIAATVLEKYAETGEFANTGKALYKLANLETLSLRVFVSETQLSQIKIGQQLTVRIDAADSTKKYRGTVAWIASQAEFTPKTIQTKEERVKLVYAVKVRVTNDGSLKLGMPGEIVIAE